MGKTSLFSSNTNSINSMFSSNVNTTNTDFTSNTNTTNTAFSNSSSSSTSVILNEASLNLITQITLLNNLLLSGNNNELTETLSLAYFNQLSRAIYLNSLTMQNIFVQSFITSSLEALMLTVFNLSHNSNLIIKFQTSHDILNDMNLLKEYLNKKNNVSIFPHTEVTIAPASLKPEYQIYIDLYGFPSGAIFNTTLLGQIISDYNIQPNLSEPEFSYNPNEDDATFYQGNADQPFLFYEPHDGDSPLINPI